MYTVYAIASLNRKYVYVGFTSNLTERLLRHNNGLERTTKPYAPFLLVYTESAPDRPSARLREKYWKSRSGKRKIYKIIQQQFKKQLPHY